MGALQLTYNSTALASQTFASTTSQIIDLTKYPGNVSLQVNYSDGTTGAKTFTSGVQEVDKYTFAAKASTGDGDYFVVYDYVGNAWAVALDTTGGGANTPTGAAWTAIPADHKVYTDVSGATTGTDIELLVATAINALTGFTDVITTSNSSADLSCTAVFAGVVTAGNVYSKAGAAGTGSITFTRTTTGTASKVNPVDNTVTITNHGQATGSKGQMTTTSALPGGLSTSTDYFIIKVDANTIRFASSLANAVAGTAITLTSSGVGTQTFTPTSASGNTIKAQGSLDGVTFMDIDATNFPALSPASVAVGSSASAVVWDVGRPTPFNYINILYTPTSGQTTFSVLMRASNYA